MVQGKVVTDHYKVVWVYGKYIETIAEMYDKPRRLCYWWVREHKRDFQYTRGMFYVVGVHYDKTS